MCTDQHTSRRRANKVSKPELLLEYTANTTTRRNQTSTAPERKEEKQHEKLRHRNVHHKAPKLQPHTQGKAHAATKQRNIAQALLQTLQETNTIGAPSLSALPNVTSTTAHAASGSHQAQAKQSSTLALPPHLRIPTQPLARHTPASLHATGNPTYHTEADYASTSTIDTGTSKEHT